MLRCLWAHLGPGTWVYGGASGTGPTLGRAKVLEFLWFSLVALGFPAVFVYFSGGFQDLYFSCGALHANTLPYCMWGTF